MKKVLILILVLCMVLAGCGKTVEIAGDDPVTNPVEVEPTPVTETETPAPDTAGTETETPAAPEAETEPVPTDGPGMIADMDMQAYYDFIAGGIPCVFAKDALGDGSTGDTYFINELVMATSSHYAAEDLSAYFNSASYAFIDCGNDGNKELALQINLMPTEDSEYYDLQQYFIFKYMDGELKLVGSEWGYYRSWVELNPYGVFNYNGSNGAASYYIQITFVDADGQEKFLYSDSVEMGMAEPGVSYYYIPDSVRPEDYPYIEMADSDTQYYCMEAFSFEPYTSDTDSDAHAMNFFYRFTDADDNDAEPSDELKAFYDEINLHWYDTDTIGRMMDERMLALGITEDVLTDMSDPEWEAIDFDL